MPFDRLVAKTLAASLAFVRTVKFRSVCMDWKHYCFAQH